MAKYHLNKDGLPAVCKAHVKPCPIGGEHFESKAEALEAAEDMLAEEEELFPSHKKLSYHVDATGAAAPCDDPDSCKVKPFGVFTNVHATDMDIVFGAAAAFRSSIGALNSQNQVPDLQVPPPPKPPSSTAYTNQARAIRSRGPLVSGDPNHPQVGDERVIDNVVHTWADISGDGCRTTIVYGWKKSGSEASVPDPVDGEERTENGRIIRYEEDIFEDGLIVGTDIGPDNNNFSGRPFGQPRPSGGATPSYGSNSWAGGASYTRC